MKTNPYRTLWKRAVQGMPIGVTIGYMQTILFSFLYGDGSYLAAPPSLIRMTGGEIHAVLAQCLLFLAIGAVSGAASIVWNQERWSLLRQSLTFFLILGAMLCLAGWIGGWFVPTWQGLAGFLSLFTLIFAVIWLIRYIQIRRSILAMNRSLVQWRAGRNQNTESRTL